VSGTEKSRISRSSQLKRGDESISGDSKKMREYQIVIIAGAWRFRDIPGNSEQRRLLEQDGRNNGKRSRMWSSEFHAMTKRVQKNSPNRDENGKMDFSN
jgi:hypothetical protein